MESHDAGNILFSGLGGTSANDVWVVGSLGNVFHYDGAGWTAASLSTVTPSVGGTSLSGLWEDCLGVSVVGASGTVLCYRR